MNRPLAYPQDEILCLEYPQNGAHRARKIICRSKAIPTGKYPSWKMKRMMHWESPHELNAFRLLDGDPAVLSFHEQPLTIRFILNGVLHWHYPDVLVDYGTRRELWEIKPACDAADPDLVTRTHFLEKELTSSGLNYRVVIGEDLAREPRLSNFLKFLQHGRRPITHVEREQVRLLLENNNEISWGTAMDLFGPSKSRIFSRLFLEGYVGCNVNEPLTSETKFWGLNH